MIFYHGTSSVFGLLPGDMILPVSITGKIQERGRKKHLDKIFMTLSKKSAKIYAGRAKNVFGGLPVVFEVEPLGDIEIIQLSPGTEVIMADMAKIIRKITG